MLQSLRCVRIQCHKSGWGTVGDNVQLWSQMSTPSAETFPALLLDTERWGRWGLPACILQGLRRAHIQGHNVSAMLQGTADGIVGHTP